MIYDYGVFCVDDNGRIVEWSACFQWFGSTGIFFTWGYIFLKCDIKEQSLNESLTLNDKISSKFEKMITLPRWGLQPMMLVPGYQQETWVSYSVTQTWVVIYWLDKWTGRQTLSSNCRLLSYPDRAFSPANNKRSCGRDMWPCQMTAQPIGMHQRRTAWSVLVTVALSWHCCSLEGQHMILGLPTSIKSYCSINN